MAGQHFGLAGADPSDDWSCGRPADEASLIAECHGRSASRSARRGWAAGPVRSCRERRRCPLLFLVGVITGGTGDAPSSRETCVFLHSAGSARRAYPPHVFSRPDPGSSHEREPWLKKYPECTVRSGDGARAGRSGFERGSGPGHLDRLADLAQHHQPDRHRDGPGDAE